MVLKPAEQTPASIMVLMELLADRAGASFHTPMRIGKFQGMIWPTTPRGSWKW